MLNKVYWITGMSGSGKTTIGTKLYYHFKDTNINTVLLDGDAIKGIFEGSKVDYSIEGRKKRGYQYAKLCKFLFDQGVNVICCTIAMVDEIREWNRENIERYVEVFIDVEINLLKERDAKGLYQLYASGSEAMLGSSPDQNIEFPKNPTVTINNTMDNQVDQYVEEIIAKSVSMETSPKSFTSYWNDFYSKNKKIQEPSDFAKYILQHLLPCKKIIDIGCGNGRDSVFFARNGLKVTSVDSSRQAISSVNESGLPIFAICDDFVNTKALFCVDFDYCYSRWSIHSINKTQEDQLLENFSMALKQDGLVFIEARTVNDYIYGMGENVGEDEYIYNNHYRRFIRPDNLKKSMENHGFEIIFLKESNEFSVVNEDQPTLVRIIAKKK